jgi:dTDP-glucose 4,6-dehydratase
VQAYVRTYGVDALVTRGSNTYGPNQYPEKVLPLFVTNALDGLPLPLYGDGRQVRDWLFVEDHCAGIHAALTRGASGRVYNLGGGDERENRDVARMIVEATGADPSLVRNVPDRSGHDRRYALDSSRAHDELGWSPAVPFVEGFARTVGWYREHRDWWEPIKSSGGYRAYYESQYAGRLKA